MLTESRGSFLFPWYVAALGLGAAFLIAGWGPFRSREKNRISAARNRLFESTSDAVIVLDPAGCLIDINPAAQNFIGRAPADVAGQPIVDVMANWPRLVKLLREIEEGDAEVRIESGQSPRHLELRVVSLRDERDQPAGRLITMRDVTASKQAEHELRENERHLWEAREVLEAVTSGTEVLVVALDPEFRYTFLNEAYREEIRRLAGRDVQLGDSMLDVFAHMPDQQAIALKRWSEALRGESANCRIEFADPDHYRRVYDVRHTPIRDAQGNVIGAGEVAFDVTEQVQAGEALRSSEERFRTICDTAPVSIWQEDWTAVIEAIEHLRSRGVTDFTAYFEDHPEFVADMLQAVEILDVNQWTVDLFEARHKADVLVSLDTVFATPETLPGFVAELTALAEGRRTFCTEGAVNTARGNVLHVLLAMSFPPPGSSSGRVLVSKVDISPCKQAEEALLRSESRVLRQNAILTAVNAILEATLSAATEEELGQACLDAVKAASDSKFGFIGEIGADGVLYNIAISSPGWDVFHPSDSTALGMHERVLLNGKGFFTNEPDTRPDQMRMRSGHPSLESFLGVPLVHNQQTIGIVSVANREGGYTEGHLGTLEALAPVIVEALLRKRAEAEAEESQSILEALMESVPEGITIASGPDARIHMVSRHGQELVGGPHAGLTAAQVAQQWKVYHPDGVTPVAEADLPLVRASRGGETVRDMEIIRVASDGRRLLLSCNAGPIRDREGNISGGVVAWRDVSELKEMERQHSRFLALALNGFWIVDMQGRFREVNDSLCRMLGYSQAELLTMNTADIEVNETPDEVLAHIAVLRERGFDHFESRNRRKDGELVDIEISATYLETGGGQMIGFCQDISERKRAEAALQRAHDELEQRVQERTAELQASEERFRQLADNVHEVFWMLEPQTRQLLYVSPAYDAICGRSREELYKWPQSFLAIVHPDDRAGVQQGFSSSWKPYDGEFRIVRPDGTLRWIRIRSFPVYNEKGEAYRLAGIAADRTDQKAAEAALRQAERLTIAGKMAASLAHEINNPLQAVIGCLGLAQTAMANAKDPHTYLQVARQEVQRTARIVSQLRSLGRPIQSERRELTDLCSLIDDVLMLNKKNLQNHHVEVTWEPDPGLPRLQVAPDAIRQVFLNLVLNAVDAMTEGGQLRLSTTQTASPDGVQVVVADSGKGVVPEAMDHLFEAFYSTKPEGLGVGLFVSQSIVQQHGGRIEVESNPGAGTTFTLWLPAQARESRPRL